MLWSGDIHSNIRVWTNIEMKSGSHQLNNEGDMVIALIVRANN
jgi:hypothetical protein